LCFYCNTRNAENLPKRHVWSWLWHDYFFLTPQPNYEWNLFKLLLWHDWLRPGASCTKLTCVCDISFVNFFLWNIHNFVK
jgi:hypothetical protein